MQSNHALKARKVLVLREHDSVWAEGAKAEILETAQAVHDGLRRHGYAVIPIQVPAPDALPSLLQPYPPGQHVVFNWYEGVEPAAEDGAQVVGLLEKLGYVFTGADALVFRTTQNKFHAKRVLAAHDISTPAWQSLSGDGANGWNCYPAIVKIANEHGSEYLTEQSVVHDATSLRATVTTLRNAGFQSLMVSDFIEGRELTVSLWGNGALQVLPLLEVDYSKLPISSPRLRTYAAKLDKCSDAYQKIKLVAPQDLSPALIHRIERIARKTYRAFGLRDYGRVDIRLRDNVPYVIDVNCNPDITGDGSFTYAAMHGGYNYATMLDHILQFAIRRVGGDET